MKNTNKYEPISQSHVFTSFPESQTEDMVNVINIDIINLNFLKGLKNLFLKVARKRRKRKYHRFESRKLFGRDKIFFLASRILSKILQCKHKRCINENFGLHDANI